MFKIRKTSHLLEGLGGGAVIAGLLLASAGSAFADTKTIGLSGVASNFTVAPDPGPGDSGGFGDTIPDAFSFTAVTGAVKDTPTASNTVTISGLSEPVPVTVSGTGLPQIRINNGNLVSSGTISNGDTLTVSLVPSAWGSTYEAQVTVGGGTAVAFSVASASAPTVGLAASTLPDGDVNQAYNAGTGFDFKTLASLAGGAVSDPPTSADLSWTSGTLPDGMTLSAIGVLSGTPTTAGEYTFTVTATLETGIQDSQSYTVYIFADPLVIEGGN